MHVLQQSIHFASVAQRLVVVRREPLFQIFGFADIDDLTVAVLHQIDARAGGKGYSPGRIEHQLAGRTVIGTSCSGKSSIGTPGLSLPRQGELADITAPTYRKLQAALQMTGSVDTLSASKL